MENCKLRLYSLIKSALELAVADYTYLWPPMLSTNSPLMKSCVYLIGLKAFSACVDAAICRIRKGRWGEKTQYEELNPKVMPKWVIAAVK
jgi:hypothetical protein